MDKRRTATVDVGREHLQVQDLSLGFGPRDLGQVAAVGDHQGGKELHGIERLEPGGPVGDDGVGDGMRLVEPVAGKRLDQTENVLGD